MSQLINPNPSEYGTTFHQRILKCPQLASYYYNLNLDLPASDGRQRGSLIHVGLAHHYALESLKRGVSVHHDDKLFMYPQELFDPEQAIEVAAQMHGSQKWAPLAKQVLKEYITTWSNGDLLAHAVEHILRVDIEGFTYGQRVDMIAEDAAGRIWLIDHKCLPAGTRVATNEGWQPIETMVNPTSVVSAKGEGPDSLLWSTADPVHCAGVQPVYLMTLANGLTLRAGGTHPILTRWGRLGPSRPGRFEWIPVDKIKPEETLRVAIPLGAADREDSQLSDALLIAAALVTCDASFSATGECRFHKKSAIVRRFYTEQLDALHVPWREEHEKKGTSLIGSRKILPLLEELGVKRVHSPQRVLPSSMQAYSVSQRQAKLILGGLWSGDGMASVSRANGTSRIVYSCRSKKLCQQVQDLLLYVGIPATLTASSVLYKGNRVPTWFTTVVGEGKRRFTALVEAGEIPIPDLMQPDTKTRAGNAKSTLAELKAAVDNQGTSFEIEGNYWWVRVDSVDYQGDDLCYDLTVPKDKSFMAENIMTHNSGYKPDSTGNLESFALDIQFVGYHVLGQHFYGQKFGGVLINCLSTSKSPFNFSRHRPGFAPWALSQFPKEVARVRREWDALKAAGTDPYDYPKRLHQDVCYGKYGPCDGYTHCKMGPTIAPIRQS